MHKRPAYLLVILSAASACFGQSVPDIGQWIKGPLGNRHDLVPDAVTSAQLAIVGSNSPLTNQATVFLGCKGVDGGKPVLELRFLVPTLRGFNTTAIGTSATIAIGDDRFPIALDSFPVQNMTMFVVQPSAAEAKDIASLRLNQRASLYLYFVSGGQKSFFLTTLADPSGPVSTVLTACNIAMPARAPIPTNAATPAMKRFTFQGLYLGMAAPQAALVEKSIATTPIKPGPGGGVDFETPQFYFISVTTDDEGLLSFYKVCGKTSGRAKAGLKSGMLYDAAIKAFGPATGKSSNNATTQWDKTGGVDARYEWDSDEEPGGCLYVSKVARP